MIMPRYLLFWFLILTACTTTAPPGERADRRMIARVGADTLFLQDFKNYVAIQKGRTIDVSKKSHRDLILDELVERRLIQRYGYDQGYDTLDDIRSRVRDRESEMLYEKIMRALVVNPAMQRSDLEATYGQIRYEKRVSQIFIGHSQVTRRMSMEQVMKASRSRDEAKRIADSVYKAVSEKPSLFGPLAAEYSSDETGQYNGGDLGFLRLDQVDPQFQVVIASLDTGQISAPAESPSGFHIFYITDKRESEEFRSFDAHLDYITNVTANSLLRQPTGRVRERFRAVEDSLFANRHFRYDEDVIRIFLKVYNRIQQPIELATGFDSLQLNLALATFDSGSVKVREIVREMSDNTSLIKLDTRIMKEGLRRVARTRIFGDAARGMGLELSRDEADKLSAFEADEIYTFAIFRSVFDPVRYDESKLKAYYEANNSRFKALDQVKIKEIRSRDRERMVGYAGEIRRLNDFDTVFENAVHDSGTRCITWPLTQDDKKDEAITFANQNLKVGQTSDLLSTQKGEFFIVKLVEKVEGTLLPYKQVRSLVVQDYVSGEQTRLRNNWMTSLHTHYDIEVRKDLLDDAYDIHLK